MAGKLSKLPKKDLGTDSEPEWSKSPKKVKMKPDSDLRQEVFDVWYAIEYQDRHITKLKEENADYRARLKIVEKRLESEVKDIKTEIQGIKTNLESIVDVVKVSYVVLYLDLSNSIRKVKRGKQKENKNITISQVINWNIN